MVGLGKGDCDDGNRSTGICGGDLNDLCLLAPASKDMEVEVCGWCLVGYVGYILNRCLPLVSVRAGFAILADHSDEFHHVAFNWGDTRAQAALSSLTGC